MIKLHFVKQPVLSISTMSPWFPLKKRLIYVVSVLISPIMHPYFTAVLPLNLDVGSSWCPIEGTVGCMDMHMHSVWRKWKPPQKKREKRNHARKKMTFLRKKPKYHWKQHRCGEWRMVNLPIINPLVSQTHWETPCGENVWICCLVTNFLILFLNPLRTLQRRG